MKEFVDGCNKKIKMVNSDYYLLFHETPKFLYYMSKSKIVLKKKKVPGISTRTDTTSNSINVKLSKTDWEKFDFNKIYKEKFLDYVPKIFRKDVF